VVYEFIFVEPMADFVKIAPNKSIPEGRMVGVKVRDKEILIANIEGNFYAVEDKCTHLGCRLSEGILREDRVTCPCHFAVFNVKDGSVIKSPAKKPLLTYEVVVLGEDILVKL
jgi:3-phenylpropionate/trans-cinnamate dioxygenase ferredoxin subunit